MCCAFCALPRSKQFRQPDAWWVHCPMWAMHLIHLPSPSCSIYLLHIYARCAVCLLWGAGLRLWHSWPMWTVQDPRKMWLLTDSLLTVRWEMQSWGQDYSSPLYSSSGCHTITSLPPGKEGHKWQKLSLLWFSLGHNICSVSSPGVTMQHLSLPAGKVLWLSLSLWCSHGLGYCVTLASSDCPQGIQIQSLP